MMVEMKSLERAKPLGEGLSKCHSRKLGSSFIHADRIVPFSQSGRSG